MKNVLLVLSLIVSFQANAQLKMVDSYYQFQKITNVQRTHAELFDTGVEWAKQLAEDTQQEIRLDQKSVIMWVEVPYHFDTKHSKFLFEYTLEFGEGWYQEKVSQIQFQTEGKAYGLGDEALPEKKRVISEASFSINMLSDSLLSKMYDTVYSQECNQVHLEAK
ncbi:hypothetical protein BFP72_06630 [Reichenbachiella sp. 5M10]|uniref:hypothetical protein n=1 Tax=Reichenbachiella sp. 5M10 TaxID=1889772 RepID=UPI000C158816|nr:hypothetical protein [Reichenbachiella sp. 5M10]PIB35096.1 hypothetical protein BFP72_06630 [Reichenbachiella sp. 5M10]